MKELYCTVFNCDYIRGSRCCFIAGGGICAATGAGTIRESADCPEKRCQTHTIRGQRGLIRRI